MLRLGGHTLRFMHVWGLCRSALWSVLSRLAIICLSLLRLMRLLCLLHSKELLLLKVWLAVGYLLLKMHLHVDRSQPWICLHRSELSSIQPGGPIG